MKVGVSKNLLCHRGITFLAALTLAGGAYAQSGSNISGSTTNTTVFDNRNALAGTDLIGAAKVVESGAVGQAAVNVFPKSALLGGNAHGCAGNSDIYPFGASGSGSSLTTLSERIRIISPTLAVGTLVDVRFNYAFSVNYRYRYDPGENPNSGSGIGITADGRMSARYTRLGVPQIAEALGHLDYYENTSGPNPTNNRSGLFNTDFGTTSGLITNVAVGDSILLSARMELFASGTSGFQSYSAADLQVAMAWGVEILTDCDAIFESTGTPVPSPSDLTPTGIGTVIPPFQEPTGLGSSSAAPEPATLALMALGIGNISREGRRRRPRRGPAHT
jgi:hypothetical protein